MSKPSLQLVHPDGGPETCSMADAILALAAQAISDKPSVFLVVWESADGTVRTESVPDSFCLRRGLVTAANEMVNDSYD